MSYRPRKIHEYDWMGKCARCGKWSVDGGDCMTDAEIEERKKWEEAAEIGGWLMRKIRKKGLG